MDKKSASVSFLFRNSDGIGLEQELDSSVCKRIDTGKGVIVVCRIGTRGKTVGKRVQIAVNGIGKLLDTIFHHGFQTVRKRLGAVSELPETLDFSDFESLINYLRS